MKFVKFGLTKEEEQKLQFLVESGLCDSKEEFIKAAINAKLRKIKSKKT